MKRTIPTYSTKTFVLTTCLVAGAGLNLAQATEFNANVGIGAAHIQSHVKGEKDQNQLYPYAELQYGMVTLNPDGLGLTTSLTPTSALSFVLQLRESSFNATDNKVLSGLDKRDETGELLVNWVEMTPWADVSAFVSADLMDTHGGYEAGIGLSKQIPMLGGVFIPQAGIQYQSDKLVDYYYGVKQHEASNRIQAYKGEASFTANVSLSHIYKLSGGWHTATAIAYDYLGDGIRDSSIVEQDGY